MGNKYKPEYIEYLKEIYKGRTKKEIAEMMNERFSDRVFTPAAVSCYMSHLHLHPGIRNFDSPHYTKFWRNPGAERIRKDGYIYVKYADPNVWKKKSDVVWHENTGVWPDIKHQIVYLNGDKRDVRYENLYLLPKEAAFVWSKTKKQDPEINRLICLSLELRYAIKRRCLELDSRTTGHNESIYYRKLIYSVRKQGELIYNTVSNIDRNTSE